MIEPRHRFRNVAEPDSARDGIEAGSNSGLIVLPSAGTNTPNIRRSILLMAVRYRLPVINWDKSTFRNVA